MKKGTKYVLFFCVIALIAIIPLVLNQFIFGNDFPSRVSNDGWASFFGSYFGAIIGAITSLVIVKIEIENEKRIKQREDDDKIKPYLYLQIISTMVNNGTAEIRAFLHNVGQQAACDVHLYDNDKDGNNMMIWTEHLIIPQNDVREIKFTINVRKSEYYKFVFYDVKSNRYEQEFRTVCEMNHKIKSVKSFIMLQPYMEKRKS